MFSRTNNIKEHTTSVLEFQVLPVYNDFPIMFPMIFPVGFLRGSCSGPGLRRPSLDMNPSTMIAFHLREIETTGHANDGLLELSH